MFDLLYHLAMGALWQFLVKAYLFIIISSSTLPFLYQQVEYPLSKSPDQRFEAVFVYSKVHELKITTIGDGGPKNYPGWIKVLDRQTGRSLGQVYVDMLMTQTLRWENNHLYIQAADWDLKKGSMTLYGAGR